MIDATVSDMERRLRDRARSIIEAMYFDEAAPEDLTWILYLVNTSPDWFCNLCAEMNSTDVSPDRADRPHGTPIPTQREVVIPTTTSHFNPFATPPCCEGTETYGGFYDEW